MYSTFWYLLFFVIALGVLITFHELGHFCVARYFNVKVYRFSIGFGKTLFAWHDRQGTEYTIALIPLGGYVKMADEYFEEVSEHEKPFSFRNKSLFARSAIVAAGPIFNFILAIFACSLAFMIGLQSFKPIVGTVDPNSIMGQAGLKSGQEIMAVNDHETHKWTEIISYLVRYSEEPKPVKLTILNLQSNQKEEKLLNLKDWRVNFSSGNFFESLGFQPYIYSIPANIGQIIPDSPADKAGLKLNDQIISVQGNPIKNWQELLAIYQKLPPNINKLEVTVLRGKQQLTFEVIPDWQDYEGKRVPKIGVGSGVIKIPEKFIFTEKYGIIQAFWQGTIKTAEISWLTLVLLGKMIIGKLSLSSISGPIGIAQGAGMTASQGLSTYLEFIATLSISLGIINFLPIPMLDGGHLMFFVVELIRGKPVSVETQVKAMKLGLFVILCLMVVGITNDLKRILS